MNIEKLIRFAFASRKRKIMTLVLAGAAGIGALAGGGSEKEPAKAAAKAPATTSTTVAAGKLAATTSTSRPGNPDVYTRIAAMTDCSALQEEFDLAEKTSKRSGGTESLGTWRDIGISYMKAADDRMADVGCYDAKAGVAPVSYANCDEVRAAGKAPLHRGEPGYSTKLDRDGDGVACSS